MGKADRKSDTLRVVEIIVIALFGSAFYTVDGQCTNATYPLELTASSTPQYINSPDYSDAYPANSSCAWRITSPSGSNIVLNVEDITLSTNTLDTFCIGEDKLTVYNGENETFPQLTEVCPTSDDAVNSLYPTATTIFITFTSESSPFAGGFTIMYFANDESSVQPDCNVDYTISLYVSSIIGTLISPLSSTSAVNCNLTFISHLNNTFTFQFIYMNLLGGDCSASSVTIYDGNSLSDTQLHQSCTPDTTTASTNVTTTGYSALMVLNIPLGNYSLLLTYFTNPNTNDTCESSEVPITAVYNTENYIESEGFGAKYSSRLRCRWLITAQNSSMAVEVYFDNSTFNIEYNFYCGYDYVVLYDGDTARYSKQLTKTCGTSAPSGTYRTTSNQMLVYFKTDYSVNRKGFRLVYKAVDNSCDSLFTEYDATYNVNEITTVYRNISSPNYDGSTDYPRNSDVYWLLTNANHTYYRIVVEIQDIKLEKSSNCIYDRVMAYNGSCTTDTVIGTACGSRKMRFDLYNEKHLIRFVSDGILQYRGFYAYYYIIPLPTPIPPTTTTEQSGPALEVVVDTIKQALLNYSNENLPTRVLSDPINASIDFYLVGINGLDEADQVLTTTGQFQVTWFDGNMAWDPTKRSGMTRMLMPQDDIWKPDIVLMNGVTKVFAMGASFMFIDIDYNGSCIWRPYQVVDTSCQVIMTNYPYDRQVCSLQFGTWSSSDTDVLINFAGDGMKIHEKFTENSVWKLVNYQTSEETLNAQRVVRFTLTLERSPLYVTFYITIPLIMLAFINVFTFTIPTGSGEKSGFAITVFLSFVVILIVVSESMPKNSEDISLFAAYILAMTMMSAVGTCITVLQIRILTLELFKYAVPLKIKSAVRFTKRIIKSATCFEDKKKTLVKPIGSSAADVKQKMNSNSSRTTSIEKKSVDSIDTYTRYENRRFSWLEDDNLYANQSYSSGISTSMSTRSDMSPDLALQRELTAGSIMLYKDTDLEEPTHNDIDSENGSTMFSDEDEIEQMIEDITKEDSDIEEQVRNDTESNHEDIEQLIKDVSNEDANLDEAARNDTSNGEDIEQLIKDIVNEDNTYAMAASKDSGSKDEDIENTNIDIAKKGNNLKKENPKDTGSKDSQTLTSQEENHPKLKADTSCTDLRALKGDFGDKQVDNGITNRGFEEDLQEVPDETRVTKTGKHVTFKDEQDLSISDDIQSQSKSEKYPNVMSQNEFKRPNTENFSKFNNESCVDRPSLLKTNTIAEISLERSNKELTEDKALPGSSETHKSEKQFNRSTSFFHTKPTLSGNRPSSRLSRSDSRLSRTDSRLSDTARNPFTGTSRPFPLHEKQHFSLNGRESQMSVFYPEMYADMDVYEWEKDNTELIYDDINAANQEDEERDQDDDEEQDEDEDKVTWEDVVNCSDVYFFVSFFILTTVITLGFFLPMALA